MKRATLKNKTRKKRTHTHSGTNVRRAAIKYISLSSVVSSRRWPISYVQWIHTSSFTYCHFPQKYGWIFYCTMVCEIICSFSSQSMRVHTHSLIPVHFQSCAARRIEWLGLRMHFEICVPTWCYSLCRFDRFVRRAEGNLVCALAGRRQRRRWFHVNPAIIYLL